MNCEGDYKVSDNVCNIWNIHQTKVDDSIYDWAQTTIFLLRVTEIGGEKKWFFGDFSTVYFIDAVVVVGCCNNHRPSGSTCVQYVFGLLFRFIMSFFFFWFSLRTRKRQFQAYFHGSFVCYRRRYSELNGNHVELISKSQTKSSHTISK